MAWTRRADKLQDRIRDPEPAAGSTPVPVPVPRFRPLQGISPGPAGGNTGSDPVWYVRNTGSSNGFRVLLQEEQKRDAFLERACGRVLPGPAGAERFSDMVETAQPLQPYDHIRIGKTPELFIERPGLVKERTPYQERARAKAAGLVTGHIRVEQISTGYFRTVPVRAGPCGRDLP